MKNNTGESDKKDKELPHPDLVLIPPASQNTAALCHGPYEAFTAMVWRPSAHRPRDSWCFRLHHRCGISGLCLTIFPLEAEMTAPKCCYEWTAGGIQVVQCGELGVYITGS